LAEDIGESLALIISDINMPGGSGLTFAWAIRESTPTLPIVIISGSVEPELLNQLKTSFEVVEKPFVASALLSAIKQATTAGKTQPRKPEGELDGDGGGEVMT
jgi:CheY-like chemotaxis protein